MSSQVIPQALRDIVADTLEMSPEEVTPDLSMDTAESWDSFRHLQLILAVEGEYGVQFDPQRLPDLNTVAKLQDALVASGATL